MKREHMEHILRAVAAITFEREFIVLGSQALLAAVPNLPYPLDQSMKLDLYPANNPSAANLIDGTIGEMSPFDQTFGYYAHGVGPETAVLPRGWRLRAIAVENENTGGARGVCLSPVDLAVSKLVGGREKDLKFVAAMVEMKLATEEEIRRAAGELDEPHRGWVEARMLRMGGVE